MKTLQAKASNTTIEVGDIVYYNEDYFLVVEEIENRIFTLENKKGKIKLYSDSLYKVHLYVMDSPETWIATTDSQSSKPLIATFLDLLELIDKEVEVRIFANMVTDKIICKVIAKESVKESLEGFQENSFKKFQEQFNVPIDKIENCASLYVSIKDPEMIWALKRAYALGYTEAKITALTLLKDKL